MRTYAHYGGLVVTKVVEANRSTIMDKSNTSDGANAGGRAIKTA